MGAQRSPLAQAADRWLAGCMRSHCKDSHELGVEDCTDCGRLWKTVNIEQCVVVRRDARVLRRTVQVRESLHALQNADLSHA